jgi:hypothetical protein
VWASGSSLPRDDESTSSRAPRVSSLRWPSRGPCPLSAALSTAAPRLLKPRSGVRKGCGSCDRPVPGSRPTARLIALYLPLHPPHPSRIAKTANISATTYGTNL